MELIKAPHAELPYEQKHISNFKNHDWKNPKTALQAKEDAVLFARASGFKETGMSVNEVALMYDLLELKRPRVIVELGRNYGCSTRLFMQHVIRHGGYLQSWDLKHWPGFIETMGENGYEFSEFPNGNYGLISKEPDASIEIKIAHSIKTPICSTNPGDDRFVDFLLIDTEHGLENALGEYMRWREYLRSGCIIAFHDSELPAVKRAIDICIEVEGVGGRERLVRRYDNERIDGFGVTLLEWGG